MLFRAEFDIKSCENDDLQDTPINYIEFFECENVEDALCRAKDLAAQGTYFADAGHCGLELTYVVEVDEDTKDEKRIIYY